MTPPPGDQFEVTEALVDIACRAHSAAYGEWAAWARPGVSVVLFDTATPDVREAMRSHMRAALEAVRGHQ